MQSTSFKLEEHEIQACSENFGIVPELPYRDIGINLYKMAN
jgi:hypothetical protein